MGMFDHIRCEYPLPDGLDATGIEFQTKAFENLMERYTIMADGRLIAHRVRYEEVPEAERPYFDTQKWEANPFLRLVGSLRAVPIRDEEIPYHGDIGFCCTNIGAVGPEGFATVDDSPVDTREYLARFTSGRVEWIRGGRQPSAGVQRPRAELRRLWKERTR